MPIKYIVRTSARQLPRADPLRMTSLVDRGYSVDRLMDNIGRNTFSDFSPHRPAVFPHHTSKDLPAAMIYPVWDKHVAGDRLKAVQQYPPVTLRTLVLALVLGITTAMMIPCFGNGLETFIKIGKPRPSEVLPGKEDWLHIRDVNDAHIILEAVRLNILPLIKRRLATTEREQLKTGNVFVGRKRKTTEAYSGGLMVDDGRPLELGFSTEHSKAGPFTRSQSRMRGDYLYYEEKVETTQDEKDAKAARR
ncbi:cAMP-independent regulatory protein [Salix suchowensis]|nr:cAMP-independent regulatory protein [Salix suchowensis]